jgi:hypothetical protein
MRLSRQIHEDSFVGLFARSFDDGVEALVLIDHHRRGVVRVEAQQ